MTIVIGHELIYSGKHTQLLCLFEQRDVVYANDVSLAQSKVRHFVLNTITYFRQYTPVAVDILRVMNSMVLMHIYRYSNVSRVESLSIVLPSERAAFDVFDFNCLSYMARFILTAADELRDFSVLSLKYRV